MAQFAMIAFALLGAIPIQVRAEGWTWAGFEVMGQRQTSRDEIIRRVPVKIGESYEEDPEEWRRWCGRIKEELKVAEVRCSSIRYADRRAYVEINIVERGAEGRMRYRAAPTGDVPLADNKVRSIYTALQARLSELFEKGTPPKEVADPGYLDYSDPKAHELVSQLVKLVPPYRRNLLEVLKKDRDPSKRAAAANLLNWSVKGLGESVAESNALLDDPHSGVRNDISRFTLHFVGEVKDPMIRRKVIDHLLIQLDRPSHGDRNKALYNLTYLADKFPGDLAYIEARGKDLIEYVARTSVLSNVRDPARELARRFGAAAKGLKGSPVGSPAGE